jgi:hypothetical protein
MDCNFTGYQQLKTALIFIETLQLHRRFTKINVGSSDILNNVMYITINMYLFAVKLLLKRRIITFL